MRRRLSMRNAECGVQNENPIVFHSAFCILIPALKEAPLPRSPCLFPKAPRPPLALWTPLNPVSTTPSFWWGNFGLFFSLKVQTDKRSGYSGGRAPGQERFAATVEPRASPLSPVRGGEGACILPSPPTPLPRVQGRGEIKVAARREA